MTAKEEGGRGDDSFTQHSTNSSNAEVLAFINPMLREQSEQCLLFGGAGAENRVEFCEWRL